MTGSKLVVTSLGLDPRWPRVPADPAIGSGMTLPVGTSVAVLELSLDTTPSME